MGKAKKTTKSLVLLAGCVFLAYLLGLWILWAVVRNMIESVK